MVCDTVKPSLRAASCCRVEVVNGGAGVRLMGFFTMVATVNLAVLHLSRKSITSSRVVKRRSSSAFTSAVEPSPAGTVNTAFTR